MLEGLKLTVDTVMVDPGDSFFNLKYGLDLSDISESGKILFFMERDNKNLYQIDLETLKILSKTQFETEGPNGIGPFVTTMSRVFDDNYTSAPINMEAYSILRELKLILKQYKLIKSKVKMESQK